jgi:hypothetical protein
MRIPILSPVRRLVALAAPALLATLIAACGGGDDDHDHENTVIDTAGRLAVADANSASLRMHDLDAPSAAPASFTLANPPSALYASPGGRYAVAMQRTQDRVQFVDGGVWQEDHGDHLHDYKQAAALSSWTLSGSRPTHYDVQPGKQAALFMDGNAVATPVANAGVRLVTDASIAAGRTVATLDLSAPIHGLGEAIDDKLLTVARADDATDALPTHLVLYRRNGSAYVRERDLPTRCDGMHGSASSGAYSIVGCSDGMLLVQHTGATTASERKLATALRVGTLVGHPKLPGHFVGIATEGAAPAPVTTRFYAVDAAAGSVQPLQPTGWADGSLRRAHTFDRSGARLLLLDQQGTLSVVQRQGNGWGATTRVAGVIPAMPTAAPWPAFAVNGARDEVYLTDPVARQVVVLNTQTLAVTARRNLDHVPSAAVWLGITR